MDLAVLKVCFFGSAGRGLFFQRAAALLVDLGQVVGLFRRLVGPLRGQGDFQALGQLARCRQIKGNTQNQQGVQHRSDKQGEA